MGRMEEAQAELEACMRAAKGEFVRAEKGLRAEVKRKDDELAQWEEAALKEKQRAQGRVLELERGRREQHASLHSHISRLTQQQATMQRRQQELLDELAAARTELEAAEVVVAVALRSS